MFSDLNPLSFTLDVSVGHGLSNDKHNDKSKLLVSQINLELLSSQLAEAIDADDMDGWNTLEVTDSNEHDRFSGVKSTQHKESIKVIDYLYNDKVSNSDNFTPVTDKDSSKDRSRSTLIGDTSIEVAPQNGGGYAGQVAFRSTAGSQNLYNGRMLPRIGGWDSDSYISASMCEGDSFASSESWSLDGSGSGVRPTSSMLPVLEQYQLSQQPQQSLEPPLLISPSIASAVSSTSSSERSLWKQQRQKWQVRHPQAFDAHELWEISSPCPSTFPLHCRDTRGTIDPVRLTPMVLDRHQFCYRFHLAGKKMRWLFKNQARCVDGLQCYVRSTVVAQLLFGGHSAKDSALDLDCRIGLSESNQQVVDNKSERAQPHLPPRSIDSHHPQIIIFPAAYTKLAPIDCAVVESFVLFTGIAVFECFLHDI
ncbi:hypothetical protein GGH99_005527 [Coemansia sp. RSA 1285]|nr:hypothetical protein GGH99_005527 [Coemansia sp. RSA 1285]